MKLRNKKTGEIVTLLGSNRAAGVICLDLFLPNEYGEARECCYASLAKLNEEWEDVQEPLIKDEKIRKAIRAWAEANDTEDGITYLGYGEFRSYLNTTIDFAILVDEHRFDLLEKGKEYTVTELCGEDEK